MIVSLSQTMGFIAGMGIPIVLSIALLLAVFRYRDRLNGGRFDGHGHSDIADAVACRVCSPPEPVTSVRTLLESDPRVAPTVDGRLFRDSEQVWPPPVPRDRRDAGRGRAVTDRVRGGARG